MLVTDRKDYLFADDGDQEGNKDNDMKYQNNTKTAKARNYHSNQPAAAATDTAQSKILSRAKKGSKYGAQ